jgi:glycosyltransferase involved in cell wall biosynthesis
MGRLKNVTVTGEVEVTGTYLRDAAASVIPLRVARGIQNKILEAMAHGVPVITTSDALDGITAEPGIHVLVADHYQDFAQKTVAVLKDTSLRQRLSANALKLMQQEYRWETKLQKLEEATASISRNSNLRDLRVLRRENASSQGELTSPDKPITPSLHHSSLSDVEARRSSGTMQVSPFRRPAPFVSFVIPAKNEAKMIGQCLDAINNLDYDHARYECIVVDNGSMDETATIAKLKCANVLTMPVGTISALRNYGAREAKGDFLAFIDADCLIDKDWLKNALPHFQNPAVGCVGSHSDIPEDCTWVEKTWHRQTGSKSKIVEVDWLGAANVLVRRLAFIQTGGFNEALTTCEDVDFCYRVRREYKILADREVKSTHFGEVKTIRDFWRKEHWRGQSNFQGLVSHGFYRQELPSLLLPLYYIMVTTMIPVTLIYMGNGSYLPILFNIGAILLPTLLLSLRTSLRTNDFSCFIQLMFLYLVYSFARAAAILPLQEATREKELFSNKPRHNS